MQQLPTLKRGDRGLYVQQLQQQLAFWGLLDKASIDGDFGPQTGGAVRQFQSLRPADKCQYSPVGLEPNGIVDRNTWCELLKLKPEEIEIVDTPAIVTKEQAETVFGNPIYNNELADLNNCLQRFEISTPARIRHFLSQVGHESGGLRWLKELASGWDYEGRADLGNCLPGDGPKFKGAGALQLTGRANYKAFSDAIGDPRIMEGCDYVASIFPFTSAGFWWQNNDMNALCDAGATVEQITVRVNGGYNGLADRQAYYDRTCKVIPD